MSDPWSHMTDEARYKGWPRKAAHWYSGPPPRENETIVQEVEGPHTLGTASNAYMKRRAEEITEVLRGAGVDCRRVRCQRTTARRGSGPNGRKRLGDDWMPEITYIIVVRAEASRAAGLVSEFDNAQRAEFDRFLEQQKSELRGKHGGTDDGR